MKKKNKKNKNPFPKNVEVPRDTFVDDETALDADHATVSHPSDDDVRSVLEDLDGFRDWSQESRGNGLTYGDY